MSKQTVEWLPIDTAPKNQRILLWWRAGTMFMHAFTGIGQWDTDASARTPKPRWTYEATYPNKAACLRHPPELWMPIPEVSA